MSTRAIQSEFLLAGILSNSGNHPSGWYVWFKLAGTDTDADGIGSNAGVYTDANKQTLAGVKIPLDSLGRKQLYFDGVYKFEFYDGDPDGAGQLIYSADNLKFRAVSLNSKAKTSEYTATPDDDYISGNPSGGAFTIYLYPSARAVQPIVIKRLGAVGNTLTLDAYGSETIDGSATLSLTRVNETVRLWPIEAGNGWNAEAVDADTLDGYHAAVAATANTVVVRDSSADIAVNALDGAIYENGTNGYKMNMAVIDIGDWNMDSTQNVSVNTSSITNYQNIRAIQVVIRDDAATGLYDLNYTAPAAEVGGFFYTTGSTLYLYRNATGFFDSTSFDATSFNRGYIIIWYLSV
jgi:hypothetical protein